jgi:FecR-like protein
MSRTRLIGCAVVGVALVLGPAGPAAAQATRAGVVTNLKGTATVARTTVPRETPLKLRDDVYVRDRIATGDASLVRMLLGGKAVVTVRERSLFNITETPTTSTIALTSGQFALGVEKSRLRPGEAIEIRTPNAITGIRGTVVVTEVSGPPGPGLTTRFTLLRGAIEVSSLDPATGQPAGAPVTLKPLQQVAVTGATPPGAPHDISQAEADRIAATYTVGLDAPTTYPEIVEQQLRQAAADAAAGAARGSLVHPGAQAGGPVLSSDELRLGTSNVFVPAKPTPPPQPSGPAVTETVTSPLPTLSVAPAVVTPPSAPTPVVTTAPAPTLPVVTPPPAPAPTPVVTTPPPTPPAVGRGSGPASSTPPATTVTPLRTVGPAPSAPPTTVATPPPLLLRDALPPALTTRAPTTPPTPLR